MQACPAHPGAEPVEVLTTHQGQYPLATYSQVKGIHLLRAELLWFLSAPCHGACGGNPDL